MIVDLNKKFIDCFGNEINQEGVENIGKIVALKLFYANKLNPEEKYRAYIVSTKIGMNASSVDISAEDIILVKKVCQDELTAGAYGQIVDILEGRK